MQSDPRTQAALAAVTAQRENFRWAVAAAVEQVGSYLEAQRGPQAEPGEKAAHELGAFAEGLVDPERFSAMFSGSDSPDPAALDRMDRAHDLLQRLMARGAELFVTRLAPGGDLRAQVAAALAEIGRAFAAARSVELARAGVLTGDGEELGAFPFRRWNRAERQIAPPLVVEVDGGDVQVGGLSEFLDGRQKIVLVVRGDAPAAPLARLVSEGVTLLQTQDPAELEAAVDREGPAVIALMPQGSAEFSHVPGLGPVWERLVVKSTPDADPRAAVGSFGVFQQRQELALLRELSAKPPVIVQTKSAPAANESAAAEPAAAPAQQPPADPADRLASWLLDESGLTNG